MSHFVYFTTPILPHFDLTEMSVRACDSWYAKKGWHHGIIGWSFFPLHDTCNNDTTFYHCYLRSDETMKGHAWFLAQLTEGLSDFLEFKMRDAGSFRQRWVLPLKTFCHGLDDPCHEFCTSLSNMVSMNVHANFCFQMQKQVLAMSNPMPQLPRVRGTGHEWCPLLTRKRFASIVV